MPIAFWRDEYATGIEEIDQQHRFLFSLINRLHDAMSEGKGQEVLSDILVQLGQYTTEHFSLEEKIMAQYNYPHLEEHRQAHQELTQDVLKLQNKMQNHEQFLTIELSQFLTNWLIHHIKNEDLKMIEYLRKYRNAWVTK
ncbi:MAG: bacteriohemerythrin [Geminocystis sp.]|nr:bacteriohemerythrin [Geminocystis sp.]MCX8077209.1 bacteriohemerythrin [Geminocystis sp.]MDW8115468.1 bacteriohemerythrin [Geminocystis sp.]MDW8463009.1 bacteriohemerythrin [Geminocystis sp.]HIK38249.1 hemerythrin family protein [Geminocystis sp. M7585_C2015_104]